MKNFNEFVLIDRFNFSKQISDFMNVPNNNIEEDINSTVINANIQESISVIQNYFDHNLTS